MTSELPRDLADQFHSIVGQCNPQSMHPSEEIKLANFFTVVLEAGIEPTHGMIDAYWPTKTRPALGGDPAQSDYLQNRVYEVLKQWKHGRGAAR